MDFVDEACEAEVFHIQDDIEKLVTILEAMGYAVELKEIEVILQ